MNFSIPEDKKQLFIKTSIWNSIIEIFKEEKNIDITDYLVSVTFNKNIILVKTNNPLINSEILIFEDKIYSKIVSKLSKMGIKDELKIKYV